MERHLIVKILLEPPAPDERAQAKAKTIQPRQQPAQL
jgi:hypothetical protein